MKKLFFITCLYALLILAPSFLSGQICNPPLDVTLTINSGYTLACVEWNDAQTPCPVLYYELEYNNTPFTPGIGQGTLITSLTDSPYSMPEVVGNVWLSSVCDCIPLGGDGIPDGSSVWIQADVVVLPPPPPCNPPLNVDVYVDFYFYNIIVTWSPAVEPCPVLYYELEYSSNTFTPGTGQGTLVTPLNSSPYFPPGPWNHFVWMRSVCAPCDTLCGQGGGGGGSPGSTSAWVEATVTFAPPPPPPPPPPPIDAGTSCSNPPTEPVVPIAECGNDGSDLIFTAFYENSTFIPCVGSNEYVIWREFTAPVGGAVEISMNTDSWYSNWDDFGFAIYENCNSNLVTCTSTFDSNDAIFVENLTPGEIYYIACWNNNYNYWYYWSYWGYYWDDNGTLNDLSICVPSGCGDITPPDLLDVPADLILQCGSIPAPAPVTAIDNSGNATLVLDEVMNTVNCLISVTRTWTATDACGNETSATQYISIEDTEAPVVLFSPTDLFLPCTTSPPNDVPLFEDNCTLNLSIVSDVQNITASCSETIIKTWTATDDCNNSTTVTQTIEIVDDVAPAFDIGSSEYSISCDATIPDPPIVTAIDNCGAVAIDYTEVLDTDDCPGTTIRTWIASDNCGNTSSISETIYQLDINPPSFDCVDDLTLQIPVGGNDVLLPDLFEDVVITDDCDPNPIGIQSTIAGTSLLVVEIDVQMSAIEHPCGNASGCSVMITVELAVGVNDLVPIEFSVFPNPAHESFSIQFENVIQLPEKIELRDLQGRLVLEQNVNKSLHELFLPQVDQGTYLILLRDRNGAIVGTEKLVIL